jgi:hypothetical protein
LLRAGGDVLNLLALLEDGHATLETHGLNFAGSLVDLLSFLLGYALDVEHLLLGASHNIFKGFPYLTT